MNLNVRLALCLWFVLLFDSCGVSFPRGEAWGQEQNCERVIAGLVGSAVSLASTGEIVTLTITDVESYAAGMRAREQEMQPSREVKLPSYLELKIEPGALKTGIKDELVGKNMIFFFLDKRCGRYDRITKVMGRYFGETKDISKLLLREKKTVERR